MLQNILDNALRYSLIGTRIYLNVEDTENAVTLTLSNTAAYEMTFAPEEIMQRFVRGDASRTTQGSGLGLSIAQSFMENFGGSFNVAINGDVFTVTLAFPHSTEHTDKHSGAQQLEVFSGRLEEPEEEDEQEDSEANLPDALRNAPENVPEACSASKSSESPFGAALSDNFAP